MKLIINGEEKTLTAPLSIAELVATETGQDTTEGIAVAINATVVPASQWSRLVSDGDRVDLLTAVQGG